MKKLYLYAGLFIGPLLAFSLATIMGAVTYLAAASGTSQQPAPPEEVWVLTTTDIGMREGCRENSNRVHHAPIDWRDRPTWCYYVNKRDGTWLRSHHY